MKAPANFWSVMIALAGIALSAISLMVATANRDADRIADLDRRLSRIEGRLDK